MVLSASPSSSSQLPSYGGYRPFYVRQHVTEGIGERQRHSKLQPQRGLHQHTSTQTARANHTTTYQQNHAAHDSATHMPARPSRKTASPASPAVEVSSGSSSAGDRQRRTEYSSACGSAGRRSFSAPGFSTAALGLPCSSPSSAALSLSRLPLAANLLRSAASYELSTRHACDYQPPLQLLDSTASDLHSPPWLSSLTSTRDLLAGTSKLSNGRRLPGYEGHQPTATQRSTALW